MINSIKARTPILAIILFVSLVGYTFAQNKVVVVPLAGDGPVCCRVFSDGTLISEESHKLCDTNKTLRNAPGTYSIGFSAPLNDVRTKVKLITLDTQFDGTTWGMAGVADLANNHESVFIIVRDQVGELKDSGYNLCLF